MFVLKRQPFTDKRPKTAVKQCFYLAGPSIKEVE